MKKKLILLCFTFLCLFSSFFSFSLKARADTTITIPDVAFSTLDNNLTTLQQIAETKLQELGSNYNNYFISYNDNPNNFYPYYIYFIYQNKNINMRYRFNSFESFPYPNANTHFCTIKPDFTINNCSNSASNVYAPFILYSTYDIKFNVCDDTTFIFTNNDNSYSLSCEVGVSSVPTIYFLNELWNSTPPDTMPLLTQFIDLSLGKLGTITDFVFSSYIYLTPFVILIFYFIIYLLRRFV